MRAHTSAVPLGEESSWLALSDFIAHEVVQFLGVRSLLRFGATCKCHKLVVTMEVDRRKSYIASIEEEVARLTMRGLEKQSPPGVPTRHDISTARALRDCAERVIDEELSTKEIAVAMIQKAFRGTLEKDVVPTDFSYDLFREERKKFLFAGPLCILPDNFYFPPEGESSIPSQKSVQDCYLLARIFRVMSIFQSVGPLAHIPSNGLNDAFRIAARDVYFTDPGSFAYLKLTILKVDYLVSNCWNANDSLSTNIVRMRRRSFFLLVKERLIVRRRMRSMGVRNAEGPVNINIDGHV